MSSTVKIFHVGEEFSLEVDGIELTGVKGYEFSENVGCQSELTVTLLIPVDTKIQVEQNDVKLIIAEGK